MDATVLPPPSQAMKPSASGLKVLGRTTHGRCNRRQSKHPQPSGAALHLREMQPLQARCFADAPRSCSVLGAGMVVRVQAVRSAPPSSTTMPHSDRLARWAASRSVERPKSTMSSPEHMQLRQLLLLPQNGRCVDCGTRGEATCLPFSQNNTFYEMFDGQSMHESWICFTLRGFGLYLWLSQTRNGRRSIWACSCASIAPAFTA